MKMTERIARRDFLCHLVASFGIDKVAHTAGYARFEVRQLMTGYGLNDLVIADFYDTAVILSGNDPTRVVLPSR